MNPRTLPLFLAAAAAALAGACSGTEAQPTAPPPPTVSVIELQPESVPLNTEWVTTLDGHVNAQIRPQVSGYLVRTNFREGTRVRQGQVLFEIDPRPFEAAVAQAEAQLARANAELTRTERDLERDRPLAEERAIPRSQLDNDVAANLAAKAAVQAAQAALETARLHLEFTKVRSLIDGVAAIATAQIGDLVGPTTLLTTVSQLDPIRAYFSLSEREYLAVADRINAQGAGGSLWGAGGDLTLVLADGSAYPHGGRFLAADRQIDARTGTIRISAAFPNPSHVLRPGQFGRVQATTAMLGDALLVPQRAITELQGRAQVRIVDADDHLRVVGVTLGSRIGTRRVVTEGLAPGARVAVDAPQVRDGTRVVTRPDEPAAAAPDAAGAAARTREQN